MECGNRSMVGYIQRSYWLGLFCGVLIRRVTAGVGFVGSYSADLESGDRSSVKNTYKPYKRCHGCFLLVGRIAASIGFR